ncbi:hypothetical protein GQ54DRAFT_183333 [Martensiomyces pterosporus]|nr:hypothetical protein GQ54DRAFT_183333 [Martensiomyces pterosporus]
MQPSYDQRPSASLRDKGTVVVSLPPYSETQHLFNGSIADPNDEGCAETHASCNWDPFRQLETPKFFHTFISETPEVYRITVSLPCYISRYVRVEKSSRVLAIVGKAMARRQWRDIAKRQDNVHEQWKIYWRLFRVPLHADIGEIKAEYDADFMRVFIPRRGTVFYRAVGKLEEWMWPGK